MTTKKMIKMIRRAVDEYYENDIEILSGFVTNKELVDLYYNSETDRNQIHSFIDDVDYLLMWASDDKLEKETEYSCPLCKEFKNPCRCDSEIYEDPFSGN